MNDIFIHVIITMEHSIQFGAQASVFSTEAFWFIPQKKKSVPMLGQRKCWPFFFNDDSSSHITFLQTLWLKKTTTKNAHTPWINMFCFCNDNYEHNCWFSGNTSYNIFEAPSLNLVCGTGYTDWGLLWCSNSSFIIILILHMRGHIFTGTKI